MIPQPLCPPHARMIEDLEKVESHGCHQCMNNALHLLEGVALHAKELCAALRRLFPDRDCVNLRLGYLSEALAEYERGVVADGVPVPRADRFPDLDSSSGGCECEPPESCPRCIEDTKEKEQPLIPVLEATDFEEHVNQLRMYCSMADQEAVVAAYTSLRLRCDIEKKRADAAMTMRNEFSEVAMENKARADALAAKVERATVILKRHDKYTAVYDLAGDVSDALAAERDEEIVAKAGPWFVDSEPWAVYSASLATAEFDEPDVVKRGVIRRKQKRACLALRSIANRLRRERKVGR